MQARRAASARQGKHSRRGSVHGGQAGFPFWVHYQTMFEGSDLKHELLESTARMFFRDLNLMLIEHLTLRICKLTDPERTMGRRNLTVEFLIKNADFSASPSELVKLTKIAARMDSFRKPSCRLGTNLSAISIWTRRLGANRSAVRRSRRGEGSGSTCKTS